jgi:trigger factor
MDLKTKFKKINNFTIELSIIAEWNDIQTDYEKSKAKFVKTLKLPGFRKGKVPPSMLKDQYSSSIDLAFVEDFSEKYFILALQKEKLQPINQAGLKDIDFSFGSDFSFKAEFEINPEIKVPTLKKNIVTVEKIEFLFDDEEVEQTINNILNSQSSIEDIKDSPKENDYLICALQEIDNSGLPIIGSSEKKYFQIGQDPLIGKNLNMFDGKKISDVVNTELDLGNGKKNYAITLESIQRRVAPKLDLDFVQKMDPNCKSIDDWRTKIKESLSKEYNNKSLEIFNSALIESFVKLIDPPLPSSMFENYMNNIIHDIRHNQKYTHLEEDKIREDYKLYAENNIKWFLVRNAIIEKENVQVLDEDVKIYIEKAIQDENDEKRKSEIERFYKKPSNVQRLKDDMIDEKLINLLSSYSKIKNVSKHTKDLKDGHNH